MTKSPIVKCFSMTVTANDANETLEYGPYRYKRSWDIRALLKAFLKEPSMTSMVITIAREARDPVENTSI